MLKKKNQGVLFKVLFLLHLIAINGIYSTYVTITGIYCSKLSHTLIGEPLGLGYYKCIILY